MSTSTQLANLRGQPADIWVKILEYADNFAAPRVCRALNKCQKQLIDHLWRRFKFDQHPLISGWIRQNTIFGDRPPRLKKRPVIGGKELGQLHRLLSAGNTDKSIRPAFYVDLERRANDRNLMIIFPKIKEAFELVRWLLPIENPGNADQAREWIKRALIKLMNRFPNGSPLKFDFSNLGLTVLPKELESFKPFMGTVNLTDNKLSLIPKGLFSDCSQLRVLALNNNLLRNIPSDIGLGCPHLWYLSIKRNKLEGLTPGFLSNTPTIEVLNLDNNELFWLPPNFLSNSKKLRFFSIRDNELTRLPIGFGRNWSWLKRRGGEIFKGNPMEPYTLLDQIEQGINQYRNIPFNRKAFYGLTLAASALTAPWYTTATIGLLILGLEAITYDPDPDLAILL